jgi:hypothetical protein
VEILRTCYEKGGKIAKFDVGNPYNNIPASLGKRLDISPLPVIMEKVFWDTIFSRHEEV